jgi:hypothetical protein
LCREFSREPASGERLKAEPERENLELKKSGKDDLFATALATVEVLAREELAPLPAFPEFLTSK